MYVLTRLEEISHFSVFGFCLVSCPLVEFYYCFITKIGKWKGKQTRPSFYLECLFETLEVEQIKNKSKWELNNHRRKELVIYFWFHLAAAFWSLVFNTVWINLYNILFSSTTQNFARDQFTKAEIRCQYAIIWW